MLFLWIIRDPPRNIEFPERTVSCAPKGCPPSPTKPHRYVKAGVWAVS